MKKVILVSILMGLLLAGCLQPPISSQSPTIKVVVSILPQQYFVEKIAGDLVVVEAMTKSGEDPHTYEPTASQMRSLATADLYFSIGVEFEEAWLPRFRDANPDLLVVDTSGGIEKIESTEPLFEEGQDAHAHEGELDPHIWFSPNYVKQISQNMAEALTAADPVHTDIYQTNVEKWTEEIEKLDGQIRALLENRSRNAFMVIHPAWGYFAREYGLEMLAVETGGQEPGPEELAQLLDLASEYKVTHLFVQKGVSTKLAESLADQLGIEHIIELDPMAEDWLANMLSVAEHVAEALE